MKEENYMFMGKRVVVKSDLKTKVPRALRFECEDWLPMPEISKIRNTWTLIGLLLGAAIAFLAKG
jgi:hypothetical protein